MDDYDPCQSVFSKLLQHSKSPISLDRIRELFQSQKLFLNALQPYNRSFSQPELRADLLGEFKTFRDILVANTLNVHNGPSWTATGCSCSHNAVKSQCDGSTIESDDSTPPVPKPRKSVLHRRQNREAKKQQVAPSGDISVATSQCDTTAEVETKGSSAVPSNDTHSPDTAEHRFAVPLPQASAVELESKTGAGDPQGGGVSLLIASEQTTILPSHLSQSAPPPSVKQKTPIKVKTKHSFRQQLLRINKIASNKFLSIRLTKDSLSRKKPLFNLNSDQTSKPRRPTRTPPPPPILVFRKAAPLPKDSIDSDQIEISNTVPEGENGFYGDDISELYHDAFNAEDIESLYCSVDEVAYHMTNGSSQVGDGSTKSQREDRSESANLSQQVDGPSDDYDEAAREEEYDYYDDGECIYEELSSNEGTVYEEYGEEGENLYDNAEVDVCKSAEDEKKQLKRLKKIQKMMKRFNLTGDEIPVNAGIVKRDQKSRIKSMLKVRAGETVLILRMADNPAGLWLGKNESSKIGYVELDNIYFDTESIKAVITGFHNI